MLAFETLKRIKQHLGNGKPKLFRTKKANEIIDQLRRVKILNVTLLNESQEEVTVPILSLDEEHGTLSGGDAGGGGSSTVYPFDMTIVPNGGSQVDVTFEPGYCSVLLPTAMFSTFTINNTGAYWVYLACTVSSGEVSSAVLTVSASDPGPNSVTVNAPPTSFNILLGYILDGVGYNLMKDSVFPSASVRFQSDRTPPIAPGESAIDYYYGWSW